jgi:hypothetical protein
LILFLGRTHTFPRPQSGVDPLSIPGAAGAFANRRPHRYAATDLEVRRRKDHERSIRAAGTSLVMAADTASADVGVPLNGGAGQTNALYPQQRPRRGAAAQRNRSTVDRQYPGTDPSVIFRWRVQYEEQNPQIFGGRTAPHTLVTTNIYLERTDALRAGIVGHR